LKRDVIPTYHGKTFLQTHITLVLISNAIVAVIQTGVIHAKYIIAKNTKRFPSSVANVVLVVVTAVYV
jgi:hypothetical protein